MGALPPGRLTKPPIGDQAIFPDDKIDWAVRFGVAYDGTGDARTLVRRAYGVFYGQPSGSPRENRLPRPLESILPL